MDMAGRLRPSPPSMRTTALILLLCPGFLEMSRILYSEVTVPRKLEPRDGALAKEEVSYLITAEGNHHIVHLVQAKNLIAKDLPVFTYSQDGDLITEYPYIQEDCYYEGIVEGSAGSLVYLSTCFGISGVLQIGDLMYEIEPIENSSTFQHLIYRKAPDSDSPHLCQVPENDEEELLEDEDLSNGSRVIYSIEEVSNLHELQVSIKYLELALVTNKELFKVNHHNETLMLHLILSINNILNTVYRPMKLHIVISAVEMWNDMDHTTITPDLAQTLQFFSMWCQRDAVGRINYDHIELLVGQYYKELGFAWKGTICQMNSMGVVSFPGRDTVSNVIILAHEMGHSLGFSHDDSKVFQDRGCNCNCTRQGCIMRTSPGSCFAFSNCTMGEYYDQVVTKNRPCLLNIPSLKPFLSDHCGNGVLEKEEECDCGRDEACLQEGCCLPSTCLLAHGAACYRGDCCHKCQFQTAGRLCRDTRNACDLPEYCNGSSASCPADVFKQDGTPCGDNDRCYEGDCRNHEAQCKALFGKAARRAPLSCFREVNVRGDRCGNCGWNGTYYTKCQEENILCGRVQCVNIKKIPVRKDGDTVVQTTVNNNLCWGLEFHQAPDTYDEGSVKDGTSCGRNKICLNRTCVSTLYLNYDCTDKKCSGRGVCNNKRNCHCDFGWAPPDCKLEGFGGSVDSGPPPSLLLEGVARNMGKTFGALFLFLLVSSVLLCKRAEISQLFQRCRFRRNRKPSKKPPPPRRMTQAEMEESPFEE